MIGICWVLVHSVKSLIGCCVIITLSGLWQDALVYASTPPHPATHAEHCSGRCVSEMEEGTMIFYDKVVYFENIDL